MGGTTPMYVNIFVVVAALAIIIQAAILVALYAAFKKTSTRVESLAERVEGLTADVQTRVLPTIDTVNGFLAGTRPKIDLIVDNLTATTTTVRTQVERLDATLNDALDRARLQIVRADEMVTRTMDRVEETSEAVQKTVVSPVRVASGFLHGLTVGFGTFFGRRRQPGEGLRGEEMFI